MVVCRDGKAVPMSSRTTLTGSVLTILAISLLFCRAGVGSSGGEGLATRSTNVCCYDRTAGTRHSVDWCLVRREEGLRRFGSLISQIVGELHSSGQAAARFGSCGRGRSGQLPRKGWMEAHPNFGSQTHDASEPSGEVGRRALFPWHADATGMRDTR